MGDWFTNGFSALQRAEIAEMPAPFRPIHQAPAVSVLFNEPKLLKLRLRNRLALARDGFSALQRAEIAEICERCETPRRRHRFQCSSTSRNC